MTKNSSKKSTSISGSAQSVASRRSRMPVPSSDPITNIMITDIVLRGATRLFREKMEKRIATANVGDEESAREILDGRTMIKSLALYGASRLATRSPVGLGIVVGGFALKTLYDRGKARQARESEAE